EGAMGGLLWGCGAFLKREVTRNEGGAALQTSRLRLETRKSARDDARAAARGLQRAFARPFSNIVALGIVMLSAEKHLDGTSDILLPGVMHHSWSFASCDHSAYDLSPRIALLNVCR